MIKLLADLHDHLGGIAHSKAWERIAAVTEVHWIANAVRTVAFRLPALVRVFPNEARTDAEKRIAAYPIHRGEFQHQASLAVGHASRQT